MRLPPGFRIRGDAVVRDLYHRGRRIRITVGTTADLDTAIRNAPAIEAAERDRIDGTINLTFAALAERWLDERVQARRNPYGQALARQRARDHLLPILGDRLVAKLGEDDLWKLRNSLDAKGLATQTVHHLMGEVRGILRYGERARNALGERILPAGGSPFVPELLPRIEPREPDALTDAQVDRLIEVCVNDDQEFTLRILLLSGLRWGEFRNLDWPHFRTEPVPHLAIHNTKSRRPRLVPLVVEAVELLEVRQRSVAAIGGRISPYRAGNGGSLAMSLSARAGFPFHVHQLRHTWATRLRRAGVPLPGIQSGLGHSDQKTTERYGPATFDLLVLALRAVPVDGHKRRGRAVK